LEGTAHRNADDDDAGESEAELAPGQGAKLEVDAVTD
jgi:hypothetical protein